jgi:hypothetical protein
MKSETLELDMSDRLDWVENRINAGRSAVAAMRGDFALLIERARTGTNLGKPELEFIAALLANQLPFASVEVDRRKIPGEEQTAFEIDVVNDVLQKVYSGSDVTTAVAWVEDELQKSGKKISERTIWTYLRKWDPRPGSDLPEFED